MELDLNEDPNLNSLVGLGQSGLYNLGNTCYLNTAIQCLSAVKVLTAYFLSNKYDDDLNPDKSEYELVEEYSSLLKKMWRANVPIFPGNFKKVLGEIYEPYSERMQQDSGETYCKIIELLHEGVSYQADIVDPPCGRIYRDAMNAWRQDYSDNYSIILKLFYGQFWRRIQCDECKNETNRFESFSMINLPITNNTNNLYNCIDLYVSCEDMDDDNMINCEKCSKKCSGKMKNTVWRMPPVICFSFSRFTMQGNKINKLIDFPITKCAFPKLVEKSIDKRTFYELVAIGNHSGGMQSGHYWAYTKGTNGNWYEYDDAGVKEIDVDSLVSNNAYYLVYVKRGLDLECINS